MKFKLTKRYDLRHQDQAHGGKLEDVPEKCLKTL